MGRQDILKSREVFKEIKMHVDSRAYSRQIKSLREGKRIGLLLIITIRFSGKENIYVLIGCEILFSFYRSIENRISTIYHVSFLFVYLFFHSISFRYAILDTNDFRWNSKEWNRIDRNECNIFFFFFFHRHPQVEYA